MKNTRRERARRVPVVAVASAVAAVGAAAAVPATAGAATRQVKVSAQTVGKMGKLLESGGKVLYVISTTAAPCDSSCLAIWPALTLPTGVKGATAGSGVQKSKLGVTTDAAGAHQVTYGGKAVYWFSSDSKGTVTGNITDQWGTWKAVVVVKPHAAAGAGTTTTTSGASAGGGGVNF